MGSLRHVCDYISGAVDAWLKESFGDELKLSGDEPEVFEDATNGSPGKFESEGTTCINLQPDHESCSTDSITSHRLSAGKYYAVRRGYRPGVYLSWIECKVQVDGFSGAEYKSFKSYEEAEHYVSVATCKTDPRTSYSSARSRLIAIRAISIFRPPLLSRRACML